MPAVQSVQCSSDEKNNAQKNNRNGIITGSSSKTIPCIVGMRASRGNGVMAALMSARGIGGSTENNDDNSKKESLNSKLTTRRMDGGAKMMGGQIHAVGGSFLRRARQGNALMAALMSARVATNNSDGNCSKDSLPSSRTKQRQKNGSAKRKGGEPSAKNTRGPTRGLTRSRTRRTGRRMSSTNMTFEQMHQLTNLVSFMKNNRSERVNLLQTAMAPFEVC